MAIDDKILIPIRHLRAIKKKQYLMLLLPFGVIALGIGMQYWFPSAGFLNIPALAVTLIGIVIYMWFYATYRYNNKIPKPEEGVIVSPLEGKIKYIRTNQDLQLININKTYLDVLEIRCPHQDCILEDEMLKLHREDGTITFRFNSDKIKWLQTSHWETGDLIGIMPGKGSCTINLPKSYELAITEGQNTAPGQTVITTISHQARPERSITIEEDHPDNEDILT